MAKPDSSRDRVEPGLILLCCVASFATVAMARWFPSQDGGAHAYSAWALHRLHGDSPLFTAYFRATVPLTNWAATSILVAMRHVTSPQGTEKGFVLLYVALMIAAILFTTRRLLNVPLGFAAVFLPMIFSHMLHMGSFNMALAYGAFLLFIGFCHRYVCEPSPRRAALVGLMLAIVFTLHVQVVLLALIYTALAALWILAEALRSRAAPGSAPSPYRVWQALALSMAGLPALILCAVFSRRSTAMVNHPYYPGLKRKLLYLVRLNGVASYSQADRIVCECLFAALLAAAVYMVANRRRAERKPPPASACMGVCGLGLLAVYLAIPDGFMDAYNAEDRVMIPLLLVFAAWLVLRLAAFDVSRLAALVGTVFVVLLSAGRVHAFAALNATLAEYSEVAAAIPRGGAVLFVELEDVADAHTHQSLRRPFEVAPRFDVERNFLGNVLSGREAILASDYEADDNKPYFALKYQPWLADLLDGRSMDEIAAHEQADGAFTRLADRLRTAGQPIAYLAVWCSYPASCEDERSVSFLAAVGRYYRPVFTSSAGHMRLYELQPGAAAETLPVR